MSESTIKVFNAEEMTPQQLKEITARPRIDFTSILGIVRESLPFPHDSTSSHPYHPTHRHL